MYFENISKKEVIERLKKQAEQIQEETSSINDWFLFHSDLSDSKGYRLLWTELKALELLHCCIINRIKEMEERDGT